MSPVDQSAGRHWGGRGEPTGAWTCPTCGAKNAGPVGEGCGSCGAGSAAKNAEAARVAALARVEVPWQGARELIHVDPLVQKGFEGLREPAETTVKHALEFYLAQAQPQDGDLPTPVLRAWVLELLGPDETNEASETTETT